MALTLISILTIASVALAAPVAQRDVDCQATYISVAGDTCESIGIGWGYSDTDILAANAFLNCDDIWVGTNICIPDSINPPAAPPCESTYWSVAGDTCQSIASQFGYYDYQISATNSFLDCNDIWVNTPICLPDTSATPTTTVVPVPSCIATYISAAGDTCDSIAAQYGITGTEIYNANTFMDCSDIWTFTSVCIPTMVIVDPLPTDESLTFNPTDSITSDPPIDSASIPAATPTTTE